MNTITDLSQTLANIQEFFASGIFIRLLVFAYTLAIILLAIPFVIKILTRNIPDENEQITARKTLTYLVTGIVLLILSVWYWSWDSLATILAFLSFGIAMALKEEFQSLVGWFKIVLGRIFIVGDRIEIDGIKGDVVSIDVFYFSLLEVTGEIPSKEQSSGRLLFIPNSKVVLHPVINYSGGIGFIWNEITFIIKDASKQDKAREIMLSAAQNFIDDVEETAQKKIKKLQSKQFSVKYTNLTPTVYTDTFNNTWTNTFHMQLTLRYLAKPRRSRYVRSEIISTIYKDFTKHRIALHEKTP